MLLGCCNSVPVAMAVWKEDKTCKKMQCLRPIEVSGKVVKICSTQEYGLKGYFVFFASAMFFDVTEDSKLL